ncbi:MAG: hypothetical protein ACRD9S_04700 [Pyrinomonadaceae bacterium]
MENLFKDIRYGFRGLLRRPAFTIVALLILALGTQRPRTKSKDLRPKTD